MQNLCYHIQGRTHGGAWGGGAPPPYGKKLYHTQEKNRGKLSENEKNREKRENSDNKKKKLIKTT